MNNRISFLFAFTLSAGIFPSAADEIPPAAEKVIEETVSAALPHLVAALDLATNGENPNDFTALAKSLTSKGLGKAPSLPPWARGDETHPINESEESSAKAEVEAEHREEWKVRVKHLGDSDLKYLKGIDSNQDLKTSAEEMSQAINGYLGFIIHDKLNVDGDGDHRLTLHEYALAVPAKGEKDEDGFDWHQRGHFEHDDENNDGYLDIPEMIGHDTESIVKRAVLAHLVLTLPTADTDEDDQLSEEEFTTLPGSTATVWKEASPEGKPIPLSNVYAALYWVPTDELKSLLR